MYSVTSPEMQFDVQAKLHNRCHMLSMTELWYKHSFVEFIYTIHGFWRQKQVFRAWGSNYIPQNSVGWNQSSMSKKPASGAKLIPVYFRHPEGIKYIIVLSPERCHGNLTPADPMGLLKAWEDFKLSGCTTNEDAIREMARTYNVFGGKWMLYPSSPVKADKFWSIIAPAVVNGELTTSCVGAKVMPLGYNNRPTVCVYMNDSTDIDKIEELERAIRVLKFRCLMYFKADVKSQLGIFGTNCHDYNVCCQSYRSRFIAWMGKSVITQRCPVSHSWLPESIGQSEHAAYQLQNSLYYMNWLPAAFTYHANARQSLLKTDNHHDNNPYRYCHVCGEPNHVTEECKHPKPVWCHSCKRIGHKAKFCYMYYWYAAQGGQKA